MPETGVPASQPTPRAACDLERWFAAAARDLPWRRRRTGYRALVAELMLQQTQVSRVTERYGEFLRRFPTVRALAEADEQDVLAAWQGLGYYRRARLLHAAARAIITDHGGRMPKTASGLKTLPGVGRYTAGAIASIVHGERTPIVDGNVMRVLARRAGREGALGTELERWAWPEAEAWIAVADDPGAFNEAMMELGATVCTPRQPDCAACPWKKDCRAREEGTQDTIPAPRVRAARECVHFHTVVVRRGERILFEQRPSRGLWGNLWQTPTVEAPAPLVEDDVRRGVSVSIDGFTRVSAFRFLTTHRRVEFTVFAATSRARKGRWASPEELAELPMSNAQKKVLEQVV